MSVLDPGKLAVILVIALVVLGPERLGYTVHQLGTLWRTVSTQRDRVEAEVRRTIDDAGLPDPRQLQPSAAFHRAFAELSGSLRGEPSVTADGGWHSPSRRLGPGGEVSSTEANPVESSAAHEVATAQELDDPTMN